jgi:hypothetical protein
MVRHLATTDDNLRFLGSELVLFPFPKWLFGGYMEAMSTSFAVIKKGLAAKAKTA